MRNDHVFYGLVGGCHPTASGIEASMRAARRMRSEVVHQLWRELRERIAGLFRRRPAAGQPACC